MTLTEDIWQVIHSIASVYNPDQSGNNVSYQNKKIRRTFITFLQSIGDMLPVDDFSDKFKVELNNSIPTDIELSNNVKLLQWSYRFEVAVSGTSLPFERFIEKYTDIPKSFWAHPTWRLIHIFPTLYPATYSQRAATAYINFMESLAYVIPCPICSGHLKANLKAFPLTKEHLQSRNSLFMWSYLLHERVNRQLNNKSISLEFAKRLYNM